MKADMGKDEGRPMAPKRFDRDTLGEVLPAGGLTLLSGCTAESAFLADALDAAGERLGAMTFSATVVPGLNQRAPMPNPDCRVLTFFMTPELRALGDAVEFLPLCYNDILAELRRRKPAAALFMCAPPDADGMCSLGVQLEFIAELWEEIPVRIAHINPAMPRTSGHRGIPFEALTAYCEEEQPLMEGPGDAGDAIADRIAAYIVDHVPDGATLQTGVGKIPGAVLRSLTGRRNLRFHSGLVGDAILDLIDAGAMAPGCSATVGVAIGGTRLYDAVSKPPFVFRPVSVTHGLETLGALDNLVTINSALEVDLLGQAYAELADGGLMSGPGGASDFARGARAAGGLRIIALPADGKRGSITRIVSPGQSKGPVSLGRMEIDMVVTEHGVADLRAKTYAARALALIAIAGPQFRDQLASDWKDYAGRL
jgi:acyl-CoA hydrolase